MISRRNGMIINITSHAGIYRWLLCSALSFNASKGIL